MSDDPRIAGVPGRSVGGAPGGPAAGGEALGIDGVDGGTLGMPVGRVVGTIPLVPAVVGTDFVTLDTMAVADAVCDVGTAVVGTDVVGGVPVGGVRDGGVVEGRVGEGGFVDGTEAEGGVTEGAARHRGTVSGLGGAGDGGWGTDVPQLVTGTLVVGAAAVEVGLGVSGGRYTPA